MKVKIILFTFLALFMFTLSACNDDDDNTNQNTELLGKWKAIGFGNTNGDLRTLEPQDCEDCYTLEFVKGGEFFAKSTINTLSGNYHAKKTSLELNDIISTHVGEIEDDANLFYASMHTIQSYMIEKGQLKLFYSDKDYILFKSIN